jgi:hypothetical protein
MSPAKVHPTECMFSDRGGRGKNEATRKITTTKVLYDVHDSRVPMV